ncbi:hypothetical protein HUT18_09870 [Streptomyces sp. NA04227]|uniref:hypothetical protein n=1 Tax=Streptomyces sp. NA04227 TaxID=2742136 RepID=UPI001591D2F8|nr:hypothetical protein [Streptomyces sp. NA04227]QKW06664.1 hypothetical protein HUT18_09870 [Streptomyces sp. NA04227]
MSLFSPFPRRLATALSVLTVALTSLLTAATAQQPVDPILAQRPFPPTDVSLFTPAVYPASGPMTPATGPAPSERQLAQRLASTLGQRCPPRAAEGVRLFLVDPGLRRTVPDPVLRASAASLLCTFGEPGIAALRSGTVFTRAQFANLPSASIAQVGPPGPGETLPNILFNQRYRFEDFRQLGSTMFHETLHQDPSPGNKEELTAAALDSLVQAQVYLTDPALATSGTELTRRLNTKLMARINSGPGPRLGLFTANGPNVYPGGTPLPSFAAAFPSGGPDTPGNPTLRNTLRLIANPGTTPPPNTNFDDTTLAFIDTNQGLQPLQVLRTARTLRLDIPD